MSNVSEQPPDETTDSFNAWLSGGNPPVDQQIREADAYAKGYKDGARDAIAASAAMIDLVPVMRTLLAWIESAQNQ